MSLMNIKSGNNESEKQIIEQIITEQLLNAKLTNDVSHLETERKYLIERNRYLEELLKNADDKYRQVYYHLKKSESELYMFRNKCDTLLDDNRYLTEMNDRLRDRLDKERALSIFKFKKFKNKYHPYHKKSNKSYNP